MIDSCVRLTLDVRQTSASVVVKAKQGDTGRRLHIRLSDGGVPYAISEDCYAIFTASKPDHTKIYNPCTIANNVIEYVFTEQTCAAVGRATAEIQLFGGNGRLITSASFVIEVHKKVFSDGDVASESELGALDALVRETTALKNELEEKLENGDFSGGNQIETDPTVPAWAKNPSKPSYTAAEVGADPSGTADRDVARHNESETAHSDIRLLIQGLTTRLNALANSDDTTLDQMAEVVSYIKDNRDLIDQVTAGKVSVSDIVDNLTTSASNRPLSAKQGVALKALIDGIVVPQALKNPHALTFTGAVTESYDGSAPVTVEIPAGGSSSGGGFDSDQKYLLMHLLKNAVYERDVSAVAAQLENLLNGGEAISYTVTNNLTDVTTSNNAATVKLAFPYEAKLKTADGLELNETALTVYMGGENITKTVYANGVVSIPVVTGEIVITAKAKEEGLIYELAPDTVFDGATKIDTGYSVYSEKRDFTVMVDFTPDVYSGMVFNEVRSGSDSDRGGLQVAAMNNAWGVWCGSQKAGFSLNDISKTGERIKYVITKATIGNSITLYGRVDAKDLTISGESVNPYFDFVGLIQNMVLGGHGNLTDTGFFTGTIHNFKIYARILDEAEINEYLGVS